MALRLNLERGEVESVDAGGVGRTRIREHSRARIDKNANVKKTGALQYHLSDFRYVNLLVDLKRFQDARRLTEVTQLSDPTGGNYHQLLEERNRLEANANTGK